MDKDKSAYDKWKHFLKVRFVLESFIQLFYYLPL